LALAVLVGGAGPRSGRAQETRGPNLILSVSGGLTTGSDLWSLARQEAPVAGTGAQLDTLSFARLLRPGASAAVGATYYTPGRWGYTLEVAYLGLGSESRCGVVGQFKSDPQRINEQACLGGPSPVQGKHVPSSAVTFQAGLAYRFSTRTAQPYLRVTGGFALLGNSFVQTSGIVITSTRGCSTGCTLVFLDEESRRELALAATLALGVTLATAPGYQFRFEIRDAIVSLPVVTGAADPFSGDPIPPTTSRIKHVPTLMAGFDVVLERRRTRRY
jgi:hypothetical protein